MEKTRAKFKKCSIKRFPQINLLKVHQKKQNKTPKINRLISKRKARKKNFKMCKSIGQRKE